MENSKKIYCSLDIETSGFDPLTNEILEVGFVFFEVEANLGTASGDAKNRDGIKIVEEWTQVFKPSKEVSAQILGLTGISQKELDEAPSFAEHREFIQKKLANAVIVGHNVIFDIKFLEAFGIKFSGEIIDTLDLVQWLLPTHHSYNLENLMHTFNISHKEAHRALADSKAALILLEKLFQVHSGFDQSLKNDINKLLKPFNFPWKDFLNIPLAPLPLNSLFKSEPKPRELRTEGQIFKYQPGVVYNFSSGQNYMAETAVSLRKIKSKSLLVLPKARQVLEFYRQNLADSAVFLPELQFDQKKFKILLKKKTLSLDEVRFALKILVWHKTNWQTKTILDLNLSFFGGQFKGLITGGDLKEDKASKVLACDQSTFLEISAAGLCKSRCVMVLGLDELEKTITSNIGTKTSWGHIIYLLKSFYNLELNSGHEDLKAPVESGVAASDLFFGLINVLFKQEESGFQYVKIYGEMEHDERYQKIKSAAGNYAIKLVELNKIFQSSGIAKFADDLNKFFSASENTVKWIELAESRCALLSMPVNIKDLVHETLKPFKNLSLADSLGPENLSKFFISRLGLASYKLIAIREGVFGAAKKPNILQGDLFAAVKKIFAAPAAKVSYHLLPGTAAAADLLKLIEKDSALPAAILFSTPAQIKEFYENNYSELKQRASVFAQSGSGGSNKILRNFAINPQSLLLASDKFILKSLNGPGQVEPVSKLPVKTLILCRLPFEQFTHPYQEAISQSLPNAFMDYALPRALFNFHSIIKFFYTPILKDIYIIDAKLAKDYSGVFKDYYQFIPNAELKP